MLYNQRQELLFQPLFRHTEVQQRRLRINLGFIVRVRQLGLQVELKILVVRHLIVANLHDQVSPALDSSFAHNRVKHRVNIFWKVLQDEGQALLNAVDHLVNVFGLGLLEDNQVGLPISDPPNS